MFKIKFFVLFFYFFISSIFSQYTISYSPEFKVYEKNSKKIYVLCYMVLNKSVDSGYIAINKALFESGWESIEFEKKDISTDKFDAVIYTNYPNSRRSFVSPLGAFSFVGFHFFNDNNKGKSTWLSYKQEDQSLESLSKYVVAKTEENIFKEKKEKEKDKD